MKPTKAVYSDGYSSEQSGAEERTGTGANGGHGPWAMAGAVRAQNQLTLKYSAPTKKVKNH